MFDSGFSEILLIMVVALVVVGPERLPGLARKVGYWVGRFRRYANTVRAEIEREINADELRSMLSRQEDEIRELRDILQDTRDHMRVESEQVAESLRNASDLTGQPEKKGVGRPHNLADDGESTEDDQTGAIHAGQAGAGEKPPLSSETVGHQAEDETDGLSVDKTTHGRKPE